jgi:dimethylaniline monooxygenase (N-oxide forming)
LPLSLTDWLQRWLLNSTQGKLPPELLPAHKVYQATPIIRSDLLERVHNGEIKVHRTKVERITATGIVVDGETEIEVDAIIMCTGYKLKLPHLPDDAWRSKNPELADIGNATDLYKLMCPLKYENLFMVGLLEISGPQSIITEAQVRWAVSVLTGNIKLPSSVEMAKAVKKQQELQQRMFIRSDKMTVSMPFLDYCDALMAELGAKPTFSGLFGRIFTSGAPLRSFQVLIAVYMGLTAPAQYRLFGEHSCEELAAETILRLSRDSKHMTDKERELLNSLKKN